MTDGDTGAEATAPAVRGDVTPAVGVACAERGDRIASPGTAGRTVGSIRVMGASATVNDNNGYSASTLYLQVCFEYTGLVTNSMSLNKNSCRSFSLGTVRARPSRTKARFGFRKFWCHE